MRLPRRVFRGRTAKELSVRILEQHPQEVQEQAAAQAQEGQVQGALPWISRLEHANYLVSR